MDTIFTLWMVWNFWGFLFLIFSDDLLKWAVGNKSWKLIFRFFLVCPISVPFVIMWFGIKCLVKILTD
jgi:hypothetical protein